MKELYIDCTMGAAGDMLAGALIDLMPEDLRISFLNEMQKNLSGLAEITAEPDRKCGISGTHFRVFVNGTEEAAGRSPEETFSKDLNEERDQLHDPELYKQQEDRLQDQNQREQEHHLHNHGQESQLHSQEPHEQESPHHNHKPHDHENSLHQQETHGHNGHHHHHVHHTLADIRTIVGGFTFPEKVRREIMDVYTLIAEAEAHVHGTAPGEVHFHEVGTIDAVADVSAVCYALYLLSPDRITASPVTTGSGSVLCAHGVLPVPAPATAELLVGIPTEAGDIKSELCTPTGAALIKYFSSSFGVRPRMILDGVGRGMGTKNFDRPNCLQIFMGTSYKNPGCFENSSSTGNFASSKDFAASENSTRSEDLTGSQNFTDSEFSSQHRKAPLSEAGLKDTIAELSCNIDDMTGEEIGFATEVLLSQGALDVWTEPIQMKKSRPGILLTVLCRPEDADQFAGLLFKHTTTLGIRRKLDERYILERTTETIETSEGPVRRKTSSGYGASRSKYEYDDLSEISRKTGSSLREVKNRLNLN